MLNFLLFFIISVAWLLFTDPLTWTFTSSPKNAPSVSYFNWNDKSRRSNINNNFKSWNIWTAAFKKKKKPSFSFIEKFIYRNRNRNRMTTYSLSDFIHSLRDTKDEIHFAWNSSRTQRENFTRQAHRIYTSIPHADLILTVLATLSASLFIRRSLHRYKNANDLPLEFFAKQKRLKGLAVTVNDSDNIRFYHRPHFYSFFKPNLSRQGTTWILF